MYKHTYVVSGRWPFPTDMLRHDDSEAATPDDQGTIDRLSTEHCQSTEDLRRRQKVTLAFEGNRFLSPMRPNLARWESFSWRVESVDGQPT